MKLIKKIIGNKYLLTATAFGIWMIFFDRNDIPLQISRMHELSKLQKSERVMNDKIQETQKELDGLKNDPETLERYAREKYLMKKPNEDLFLIENVNSK